MAATRPGADPDPSQEALRAVYLAGLRRRFRDEVNRLGGGAMLEMVQDHPEAADLAFPMTYLYAWHWLRHHVHEAWRAPVLETFRGPRFGFLMDLLLCDSPRGFVEGYIGHWSGRSGEGPVQQEQCRRLLARRGNRPERLAAELLALWDSLGLFRDSYLVQFKQVAREERERYRGMLGAEDRERLALVDALPDNPLDTTPDRDPSAVPRFDKLGIIPAMGCPQTCRHCMFTWRPPRPKHPDREMIYRLVDGLTRNVLFTGGDLTGQLDDFYLAIRTMPRIGTFAILLNGDFADDPRAAHRVLKAMAGAIRSRPPGWTRARVLLQISFDEFHQEVTTDKRGRLHERIPVAKIANIVEAWPRYREAIQLALLHKQTALNFSRDVLHEGVFARLVAELGRRGHQVQVLSMAPAPRPKRDPRRPGAPRRLLKDASFVLDGHPDAPVLMTSSTIDGYGRAALLDEGETVKERDLLQQVLREGPPPGEAFDIDPMIWFNGWVTLFNAVHICLGDIYREGPGTILARQRKDPLARALHGFDRRLLEYYAEVRDDLEWQIARATGPHHLFHALTEAPDVRLHMTRRLVADS